MFWMHVLALPQPGRVTLRVWFAPEANLLAHVPLWLVCTLEVIAVGYAGGHTHRLAAEIQVTESHRRLVDTI